MSGLGVAEVARRLGVVPSTLRTWDRQYVPGWPARFSRSQCCFRHRTRPTRSTHGDQPSG
ncbi:transposase [Actinomadura sp. NPDC049753]|uniref:transposase n=1 Tax=Actinomadura sp. NPDC049753 TaxID=3154739 RepID=UPI003438EC46